MQGRAWLPERACKLTQNKRHTHLNMHTATRLALVQSLFVFSRSLSLARLSFAVNTSIRVLSRASPLNGKCR